MKSFYEQLPVDHMVRVLVEEHDVLLGVLVRLTELCDAVKQATGERLDAGLVDELGRLADSLLAAEPHHQREEEVLFPELEQAGIEGPPHVMRMEHVELRRDKAALRELADRAATEPLDSWRGDLAGLGPRLVADLSAHIAKENDILYPMALSELDASLWESLQEAAARIGPCSFPRAA
jgi:DUF438 domain-containing protein